MRNLLTLHLGTTAPTLPESIMGLLSAVTRCVPSHNCHLIISILILRPLAQNDPTQVAAKEHAFKASVEWLIKYLQ